MTNIGTLTRMAMISAMAGKRAIPKFKIKTQSTKHKHHSDQELARRKGQIQHRNQVIVDRMTKKQPG